MGKTINIDRMDSTEKKLLLRFPVKEYWRPKHRCDCVNVPRPCPFVGCKHNTYLDVKDNGNIIINFPDLDPTEMRPEMSCVLDIIEANNFDELTKRETGEIINVTKQYISRYERESLNKLRPYLEELPEKIKNAIDEYSMQEEVEDLVDNEYELMEEIFDNQIEDLFSW